MNIHKRIANWLETRWLVPSFAGWVLAGIAICFFGAATNTMAGWLYVISGVIFALLALGAFLVARSLKNLKVHRKPISPVSAGDELTVELEIENPTKKPKSLLEVYDLLPYVLDKPKQSPVELIPPKSVYNWTYNHHTNRRGVYRWHEVQLRSGSPLGLFWGRRSREASAKAIVYPQVLPLTHCALIDTIGQEDSPVFDSDRQYRTATEGITRGLRPYRQGDPTRLIHWRSSARYGELRVRELEVVTGGQEVIICLNSGATWNLEDFELAVIAAASLYFYASRSQLNVKLWTASTGLLNGNRIVLEALAATYPEEDITDPNLPRLPLIWITPNPESINILPKGSRWLFFPPADLTSGKAVINGSYPGIIINREQDLKMQLQKPLS
ncbi:MAG: DUF58 domain-containing protein [Kamptonema sp. SIO1D9]|nr:DUF58 domain-containing protein [Kamptonema sp. SIO1D9]